MNTLIDNFAVHPGVFILDEIEARGWSQRDLAFILRRPEQSLSRILSGKASVTPATAKEFSEAFGISAEFFLNLQRSYDLATSKNPSPNVKRLARLQTPYPVREMVSRGWLKNTEPELLESEMAHFFEVSTVEELPLVAAAHAAKKTDYSGTSSSQVAWLYRVRQLARTVVAPKFSKQHLRSKLPFLRELMRETDQVQFVPDILEGCGVRLVIVEGLKGAKFCGVTCWLSKNKPVIGLTTRYDRIDNFWFVLRHEIEHVLCGHGYQEPRFDGDRELDVDGNIEEEERIANRASLEFGIPSKEFDDFIAKYESKVPRADIIAFANDQNVHPGIVVGRVQKHLGRWNFFNDLKSKFRHTLINNSIYDGWGVIPPVGT